MQLFLWRNFFAPRKQKIEVTVETRQTLQIRRVIKKSRAFCADCAKETLFLSPDEVVSLMRSDLFSVETLLTNKKIHFSESAETGISICFNSLKTEVEQLRLIKLAEPE